MISAPECKGDCITVTDQRTILAGALRSYLEDLRDTGIDELPLEIGRPQAKERPESRQLQTDDVAETLDDIRADIGDCRRCKLCSGRKNIVFGVGNPNARLVFVGEAPGRDEDIQGEPFVGEAGLLLTKMIAAMGYQRQEVYICNVLKCRPPGNRDPEPDEIEACSRFMLRQIRAIRPQAIIALGAFAAKTLLASNEPISRLRGRFHDYHGIPLMPTFHPSYLLRSPEKKREAWADLQQVMKILA
jgi:DNA polymerase